MSRPAITFELALAAIARVLKEGARTHSGDWRDESASFHAGRAERHLRLLRETDTAEDHLANATCRLLMALELRERAADVRKPSNIPIPPSAQRAVEAVRRAMHEPIVRKS
jgi:hypothetical protein